MFHENVAVELKKIQCIEKSNDKNRRKNYMYRKREELEIQRILSQEIKSPFRLIFILKLQKLSKNRFILFFMCYIVFKRKSRKADNVLLEWRLSTNFMRRLRELHTTQ